MATTIDSVHWPEKEELNALILRFIELYLDAHPRPSDAALDAGSVFETPSLPPIGHMAYVQRMLKYAPVSVDCLFPAMVYVLRAAQEVPREFSASEGETSVLLHTHNFHRLFLTSMVISIKLFSDKFYTNAFMSRVGGISKEELDVLELHLLKLLDFRLFLSRECCLFYLHVIHQSCLSGHLLDSRPSDGI